MTTTETMSNTDLLEKIENCTLPTSEFNHETMLKLAWILINKYGVEKAIAKNAALKENYFINAMNSEKFNISLSRAYVEIMYYFMEQSSHPQDFNRILNAFPRLKYNFRNLVKTHYGYNILKEHRKEEPKGMKPILFTF
ncbi:hypothetical protein R3X25_08690 [Lutibacter sp. TH_r2]|uniref:hypothetical protein n=1 Tax=Lutibacter sp. TH_r2 TaxID=3082083 RepID=UPI002953B334|nr:hypothetical protein [Lutibacter sp. TH_r2]MDV7187354.1 hypothetical protein [Lutibacter sp. TH_r2]